MQLYLAFPPAAGEPPRQLKGFAKVMLDARRRSGMKLRPPPRVSSQVPLDAGAKTTVRFALAARDLSTWDVAAAAWTLARGEFTVTVGASSRDAAALSASFTV